MRFNANPEMLESAPCVIVTLKKATQVILVRALLRMKSAKTINGAILKRLFCRAFSRRCERGPLLKDSARNIRGMMHREIRKFLRVGKENRENSRRMKRIAIPVKPPIKVPIVRFMPIRKVLLISGCRQMIAAMPE